MKTTKLLISLLTVSMLLVACGKRQSASELDLAESKSPIGKSSMVITNQFVFQASQSSTKVLIVELVSKLGKQCVIAHGNYQYDSSEATVSCTNSSELKKEQYPNMNDNQIIDQFQYRKPNSNDKVLVSEFYSKTGKVCIVVQANYIYDSSTASISCDS